MNPDADLRLAFRDSFRTLLLPIDPAHEDAAVDAALEALDARGIAPTDQPTFIRAALGEWRNGEGRDDGITNAVQAALKAGNPDHGARFAAKYFNLHERLQTVHLYSFGEATSFLSHLRLAASLATHESMSAAQIAKVLDARDRRVGFGWRAVRAVLSSLGYSLKLKQDELESLFARDEELEEVLFADAGFYDAAAIVATAGAELGYPGDLEALLLRLFSPENIKLRHGPYLQILHYVVAVAEFYDHALKVLYEFSPRGNQAKWIFNRYPNDLRVKGNPVLNNAKSIDALDAGWARSKEDHLVAATALFEIIDGLEQLGFAARKDLSAWLRRWLLRIVRLTRELAQPVPDNPTEGEISRILYAVAQGETRSFGVIEQRLLDALALQLHPADARWRAHGIGDSVNASNVSRKKLGDVEFQDAGARRVVAYESHAGRLTDVYVDEHLETLRRVMPMRRDEWERIAPADEWTIEVVFVAHDVIAVARDLEIEGFRTRLTMNSFATVCKDAPSASTLSPSYREHVSRRLNESRTPQSVRNRYAELIAQ